MVFISKLAQVGNMGSTLAVVYHFSKYATFIPALDRWTECGKALGIPQNIVVDLDPGS